MAITYQKRIFYTLYVLLCLWHSQAQNVSMNATDMILNTEPTTLQPTETDEDQTTRTTVATDIDTDEPTTIQGVTTKLSTMSPTTELETEPAADRTTVPLTTSPTSTDSAEINVECEVNQCPKGERCLIRQKDNAPDFVCECEIRPRETYGHTCEDKFMFFRSFDFLPCYGTQCSEGNFTTLNYPGNYKSRNETMMLVYVPGALRFDFTFDKRGFQVEYGKDDLLVGPGLKPPIPEIPSQIVDKEAISAANFFHGYDLPRDFSIESDTFFVYWATDPTVVFMGFSLRWTSVGIEVECPPTTRRPLPPDNDTASGSWDLPTVRSGVGMDYLRVQSNFNPTDRFEIGRYTIEYKYADDFGHREQCSFELIVQDDTPPVVECPPSIEIQTCTNEGVNLTEPLVSDNSNNDIDMEFDISNGQAELGSGNNRLTYTYRDKSGNTAVCRVTVTLTCESITELPEEFPLWVVFVGAAAALALLLAILALFAFAKLQAVKAGHQADLSFNPEEFTGHKPGAPLEEEAPITNGNEKIGMYEIHAFDNAGAV